MENELFSNLSEMIQHSPKSKTLIAKELGTSRNALDYMVKNRSLTVVNFIKLVESINVDPCTLFRSDSQNLLEETQADYKTKCVSAESSVQNENLHLQEKVKLLTELNESYKQRIADLQRDRQTNSGTI